MPPVPRRRKGHFSNNHTRWGKRGSGGVGGGTWQGTAPPVPPFPVIKLPPAPKTTPVHVPTARLLPDLRGEVEATAGPSSGGGRECVRQTDTSIRGADSMSFQLLHREASHPFIPSLRHTTHFLLPAVIDTSRALLCVIPCCEKPLSKGRKASSTGRRTTVHRRRPGRHHLRVGAATVF